MALRKTYLRKRNSPDEDLACCRSELMLAFIGSGVNQRIRVALTLFAICTTAACAGSSSPSEGILGSKYEVRSGIEYSIDAIQPGSLQMCTNPSYFGSIKNGSLLFITVTITTSGSQSGMYRYFETSDFSMKAMNGQEERLGLSLDSAEAVGCLNQMVNDLRGEVPENSSRTGLFVVDTWQPHGTLTLNTASGTRMFSY